ncbi:unnamed protein product [Effrenium voratum]|nr:unnamed protein product [Effrenium voratum]
MQSFVQTYGEDLEAASVLQEVPRLRVQPPFGYADTALGVYPGPSACDPVGRLAVGDEVLAGLGPRQGRWLKITYPMEGWVQAATRDGQAILHELVGKRPNLRQVVTVRSKPSKSVTMSPVQRTNASLPRDVEEKYFKARACEASKLLREFAQLEVQGWKGGKPRQSVRGVF